MKRLIKAAIENSPAMNTLMIAILVVGMMSLFSMRRETFPEFELEIVLVAVPYPGASPEEVEEGICQKIEEAIQSIDGIKKVTSIASEGSGSVVLELSADVSAAEDVQKIVNEVRSEVDRIPSFPELAEDPKIQQVTMREAAIKVGVLTPDGREVDELELRSVAEMVRDELLTLGSVSQVDISGARDYQIDIEIGEQTLRKFGLSLQQVAAIVRRENLEIPGGTIRGDAQEVLLRGENKRLIGQQISKLPLVKESGGAVLTIGDLGNVRDEFTDATAISEINGVPGLVLSVNRTLSEDLLEMTREVRDYANGRELPGGYRMQIWADRSIDVQDRLSLLMENGTLGLILVFLVLSFFLELRLAFWVALGIPVSLLGAGWFLLLGDQTLNMLSMFSFLMALGIVVDDAIVVGENVYSHRQMGGKTTLQAAIDGTVEVVPAVVASVATTIIAFCPMFFVSGVMGKFFAVIPFAVIAMLVLSLLESIFILPCHLAHRDSLVFTMLSFLLYPLRFVIRLFRRANRLTTAALEFIIHRAYKPTLVWALANRYTVIAGAIALLLFAFGFVRGGFVPFVIFPEVDSNEIRATVTFPDGTPSRVTDQATQRLADKLWEASRQLADDPDLPLIAIAHRTVGAASDGNNMVRGGQLSGSHIGSVEVELIDTSRREATAQEMIGLWRDLVGPIPGVESLKFNERSFGPAGTPIEFKLLAVGENVEQLEAAVENCKQKLDTYPGVFDIQDDSSPGKWEYRIRLKDDAQSLNVNTGDIAETIRASYYGAEVMRLQRGRHEVKLMVRYPKSERKSLADFEDVRVRTGDGHERPLTEVAEIDIVRGYSEINRLNQKRSITISADIDETQGNARETVADMQATFMPQLLGEYPNVQVRWEGQQEQTEESLVSLMLATVVALMVMYVLLTLVFKAYIQPILILAIIPFGIIGAILGHFVMQLPLTMFSFFGLVALTGVVVNDSIVLVDFINRRVRAGIPLEQALVEAGQRRFRPVILTSATTIAGLLPILTETSFQAQILIPMATSLSFGLMFATMLVLVLIPVFYHVYYDATRVFASTTERVKPERQESEPALS